MDTYIADEHTNIHIPRVHVNVCHTPMSVYLEGVTEDGTRVTIRLDPLEAALVSEEYNTLDNEAWEEYKRRYFEDTPADNMDKMPEV